MEVGVVYAPNWRVPGVIEISFRGDEQLLPGGSMVFVDMESMKKAFRVVALANEWPEREIAEIEELCWKIAWDVIPAIKYDWHSSMKSAKIRLLSGRQVIVYREGTNSFLVD
jgi:hypothetical protein